MQLSIRQCIWIFKTIMKVKKISYSKNRINAIYMVCFTKAIMQIVQIKFGLNDFLILVKKKHCLLV